MTAPNMHAFVTKPLPTRRWSYTCLLIASGCVVLTLLDRGQSSAIAQTVSADDFAAPNLAAPIAAAPTQPSGLAQTVLLVDPAAGNDAAADGSDRAPFKTITQALQVAPSGTVIFLSPGIYSEETGERFPLRLKPTVTVQGNAETRGQDIVIQGTGFVLSPAFGRQKVTIVGADRAILSGVTVKNPDPQGYGVWIESTSPAVLGCTFAESGHDGISVMGNGAPLIRNNYFYQNGANGITLYGTSQADVRENIFEQTGFAININQKATPLLVGNRITQNKDGIVVQASAQPILRDNSVEGNQRDGLVAIAQARPDLGTATAPGGNSFRNNGQFDLNTTGSNQQIPAFGNDLDKTNGTLDLAGTSLGTSSLSSASPWSSTGVPADSRRLVALTTQRSLASADKSTATEKNPPIRAPKVLATPPAIAAASQTIPFGQRLGGDRAVETGENETRGISATSFPVPASQPSTSPRPAVPLVAIASPARPPSDPGFPVPSALTGVPAQPRLRPVQVVRIAAAPPTPAPRSPQAAASFNAVLPSTGVRSLARLSTRPLSVPNSIPLANPTKFVPLLARKLSVPQRTGSIEIPVPAPEVRSTPAIDRSSAPAIVVPSPTVVSAGLLPVPNPDAPIGNVGSASIVYRTQSSRFNPVLKLPYRVVVEATDSQQAQLRATFPNAFRTWIKGRSWMQVGAFSDRGKADQLMQTLSSQGVQATLETVE